MLRARSRDRIRKNGKISGFGARAEAEGLDCRVRRSWLDRLVRQPRLRGLSNLWYAAQFPARLIRPAASGLAGARDVGLDPGHVKGRRLAPGAMLHMSQNGMWGDRHGQAGRRPSSTESEAESLTPNTGLRHLPWIFLNLCWYWTGRVAQPAVASIERSDITSTTPRRSRSTMIVPYVHLLRQLQSSIPTTRTGALARVAARRLSCRRIVLSLAGIARAASIPPGRPPGGVAEELPELDDAVGSPCRGCRDGERTFHQGLSLAPTIVTSPPNEPELQCHPLTLNRPIPQPPVIPAVTRLQVLAAVWTPLKSLPDRRDQPSTVKLLGADDAHVGSEGHASTDDPLCPAAQRRETILPVPFGAALPVSPPH
jgi:hypothetical protein